MSISESKELKYQSKKLVSHEVWESYQEVDLDAKKVRVSNWARIKTLVWINYQIKKVHKIETILEFCIPGIFQGIIELWKIGIDSSPEDA